MPRKPAPAAKPVAGKTYKEMVTEGLIALHKRKGVSRIALEKYIKTTYPERNYQSAFLKQALKRGVADGTFLQVKGVGASGSFKFNKTKPATKKKPTKKPAAKKVKKPAAVSTR